MLELNGITKQYFVGDGVVDALRGVSVSFRESEFVAILGQSGCGKTTLLNIIGGLDVYSSGDLRINGVSTKKYKDKDWDTYRNHSIGFVFQTYNLIPHQTVLSNVELALTISGISKSERRRRAKEALEKVGLGDQLKKKPNQMSGGQIQRVAIARALVNDPDILLADEPTGALDTETSVTVMEILKEVAKDKLVIMVTHNPDLAEKYATRTIRLLDGKIVSDSSPFSPSDADTKIAVEKAAAEKKKGKKQMSFFTALSLSLSNLRTKKGRTIMTSFAGSIGIIGIALILAVSSGFQTYIDSVQEDTLSTYPLSITKETMDITSLLQTITGKAADQTSHALDKIYSKEVLATLLNSMISEVKTNELADFKAFLDSDTSGIDQYVSAIRYDYGVNPIIYSKDITGKTIRVNPSTVIGSIYGSQMGELSDQYSSLMPSSSYNVWSEILDNPELVRSQYDVLASVGDGWPDPEDPTKLVLVVDKNNELGDMVLYSLGLKDQSELSDMMVKIAGKQELDFTQSVYTYDELLGLEFKLVYPTDYYEFDEKTGMWKDRSDDEAFMNALLEKAETLTVSAIIRPTQNAAATSISGAIGYSSALTYHIINKVNNSEIVKYQKQNDSTDVFTARPFSNGEKIVVTMDTVNKYIATLPEQQQQQISAYLSTMTEDQIIAMFEDQLSKQTSDATYEGNLKKLGATDLANPNSINIFPKDFASKDAIKDIIAEYNARMESEGTPEKAINYSDYIAILLSSITTIIDTITYVLIAFVAISLVVSSIMIGIITYISVLERTKEIGILRSIGASKKDVSRVFNAETFIVGLISGCMGIIVTVLILIPVNLILDSLTGIANMALLPVGGAIILIVISVVLTMIAGIIPAHVASKRDPVIALRSE